MRNYRFYLYYSVFYSYCCTDVYSQRGNQGLILVINYYCVFRRIERGGVLVGTTATLSRATLQHIVLLSRS
ncbi:hypothetical protein I7I48_10070 [Histoplasma ohiense]|nr:hypothetical protein I7I48_10070 [Histoplasma ohiense (nom. inval.)]